ncbi:MAG: twitching motility protein PilT, partial [Phycisphaerae bacterium]
ALVRQSLVFNLKSIMCQKLLPSIHPSRSRVPCLEIMINNPSVRKLIAEERDADLSSVLKSATHEGMQDFTEALYDLITTEYIDVKVAYEVAPNPDELKMRLKGIRSGAASSIIG